MEQHDDTSNDTSEATTSNNNTTTSAEGQSFEEVDVNDLTQKTYQAMRDRLEQVRVESQKLRQQLGEVPTLTLDQFCLVNHKVIMKLILTEKVTYGGLTDGYDMEDYMGFFMHNRCFYEQVCEMLGVDFRSAETIVTTYIVNNFDLILSQKHRTKQINAVRRFVMNMYFYKNKVPFDLTELFFGQV